MWVKRKSQNDPKNHIELNYSHLKYWFAFLQLCLCLESKAQNSDSIATLSDSTFFNNSYSIIDSSSVAKRDFSKSKLDELKSDPDFNYNQPPTVAESLWDRLKMWVAYLLNMLLEGATTTLVGRVIMYVLGIILLVVIVMMLLKVDAVRVFFGGADQGSTTYQVLHENIHEMDFEKLIREATRKNEFRLGTRLIFLYALKILSDKQFIHWIPGKTNHEYVEEITRNDLKTGLNELSFYFDYAWYGNFQITPETFGEIEGIFQNLKSKTN
jgi:hypothetical protein